MLVLGCDPLLFHKALATTQIFEVQILVKLHLVLSRMWMIEGAMMELKQKNSREGNKRFAIISDLIAFYNNPIV